jgi:AcrR family transcriptional regulator
MAAKLGTEESILACASEILERDGPAGVTTRAVCTAAGITAPTLYHHFGDKDGLLNEIVSRGVRQFTDQKRNIQASKDAFEDLQRGWHMFLEFSLSRPWLFRLMIERANQNPELVREVHSITRTRLARLDAEGRLTTDVDFAAQVVLASSNGVMGLFMQGASRKDIEATGAFMFAAITNQLIRPLNGAKKPKQDRKS